MDPKSRQIKDLCFSGKHLRFKCKRCATFCCRLGGPRLTRKDVQRIEEAGYLAKDFVGALNSEFENGAIIYGSLKSKENGSCIFLRFDTDQDSYECSIYDFRPILCRLYPFAFHREDFNIIVLKFIPCCRGLNNSDGELVDERFIADHLLAFLHKAIELF